MAALVSGDICVDDLPMELEVTEDTTLKGKLNNPEILLCDMPKKSGVSGSSV